MSLEQLLASIPPGSPDETLARQVNFERLPAHVADHHGRQRPLGGAAAPAARRRASRRHRLGPRRRRDVGAARHRRADALRVLGRELEAAARRSQHADDAAEALPPARARARCSSNNIRFQRHRPARRAVARRAARARDRRSAQTATQHRHAVQHRAQLRRPRRDRRRGAARDRRRASRPTSSTSGASASSSTPRASPIRIC